MKKYILSFLVLFLVTGCVNTISTESEKETLIKKADGLDLNAMIKLNQEFFFLRTKEGLTYNNSWYDFILKSQDGDAIWAYSKEYLKYTKYIINGQDKYYALILRASELGNQAANIMLLRNRKYNKNELIDKRIMAGNDRESLTKLLAYYKHNDRKTGFKEKAEKVKLQLKNLPLSATDTGIEKLILLFDKAFREGDKKAEQQFEDYLAKIQNSSDQAMLLKSAEALKDKTYRFSLFIPLYKRLLELDNDNAAYKKLLLDSYPPLRYNNSREREMIDLLKMVSYTDDYESTIKLLKLYTKDYPIAYRYLYKETKNRTEDLYPEEYPRYIKKISSMNESKRALGEFYFRKGQNNKSLSILESLANSGNQNAIYDIAKKLDLTNNVFTEPSYKWATYIVDSKNPTLIEKLRKDIKNFKSVNAKKIKEKIEMLYSTDPSFLQVSKLAEKYNALPFSDRKPFLAERVKTGDDISFYHLLTKSDLYSGNIEEVEDAISSRVFLSEHNQLTATILLAMFYERPPSSNAKYFQDFDKSLFYYDKAVALGKLSLIRSILCIYKCNNKSDGRAPQEKDEQEITRYVNLLIKNKQYGSIIKDLARIYCCYRKPHDFNKSIYYFLKSAEAGYIEGTFSAAKIYKNNLNDMGNYLKYTRIAAKNGDNEAAYAMGNYYAERKENVKALANYEKSYQNRGFNAGIRLGYYNETGGLGLKKDVKKALQYYLGSYAIKRTDAAAMNIGLIYHFGKGAIKQDLKLAEKWYKKSKLKQAQNNLKKIQAFLNRS